MNLYVKNPPEKWSAIFQSELRPSSHQWWVGLSFLLQASSLGKVNFRLCWVLIKVASILIVFKLSISSSLALTFPSKQIEAIIQCVGPQAWAPVALVAHPCLDLHTSLAWITSAPSALQLRSLRKKSQLISKNMFNHQMQINEPTLMR